MKPLLFTPLAESDLEGILSYIAEDRPNSATSVLGRIRSRCELIARSPEIGQPRPEFGANYRSFPVQRWVIFYRETASSVEVLRVLDGARDLASLFE